MGSFFILDFKNWFSCMSVWQHLFSCSVDFLKEGFCHALGVDAGVSWCLSASQYFFSSSTESRMMKVITQRAKH